jgi:hypothetical protein
LAKKLIRRVGEADVALAGAETRPKVLRSLEEAEIQGIRAAVRAYARSLEEEIAELRMEIDSRAERRERQAELIKDKVEQGRLWRSVHIQERIPQKDLSHRVHNVVLNVLAVVGLFTFAQAYAVLEDVAGFAPARWFSGLLGGLLGVALIIVGVLLAREIKKSIFVRAQKQMLRAADEGRIKIDPAVREQLVESRPPNLILLLLNATIFVMLDVAGVLVYAQSSATGAGPSPLFLFQVIIPLAAVVVDIYLYDPTEHDEPAPNAADRRLERKLAKAERRLRIVAAQIEAKVAQIEKLYRVEEAILEVEQCGDAP